MLRRALFNIIRQEHDQLEDRIAQEQRQGPANDQHLSALRQEEQSLRREMELFSETA